MITRRSALKTTVATGLGAITAGLAARALATEPPPKVINGRNVGASGGGDLPPDYLEIDPKTGQQKGYVVLTPEERAKGFVRKVRLSYMHLKCGTTTSMSQDLAETFAANPKFYNTTFCTHCRGHFPVAEFVWAGTDEPVGS